MLQPVRFIPSILRKKQRKKIAMNRINNKCHIICTRIEVNILWCVHIIYVHHSVTLTRIIDSFDCHSMIKTYTQSQRVYKRSKRKEKRMIEKVAPVVSGNPLVLAYIIFYADWDNGSGFKTKQRLISSSEMFIQEN